jgi:hypothetical protein
MICKACNCILTEAEAQVKYLDFDEHIELCSECLRESEINFTDFPIEMFDDDDDYED